MSIKELFSDWIEDAAKLREEQQEAEIKKEPEKPQNKGEVVRPDIEKWKDVAEGTNHMIGVITNPTNEGAKKYGMVFCFECKRRGYPCRIDLKGKPHRCNDYESSL
jgi:hypothetical protein